VVILALVVTVVSVSVVAQQNKSQISAAADKPIDGVHSFDGLSRNHTPSGVACPQNSLVGGDHAPQLVNCGIFTDPVNTGKSCTRWNTARSGSRTDPTCLKRKAST
jgi:hypothetical protein